MLPTLFHEQEATNPSHIRDGCLQIPSLLAVVIQPPFVALPQVVHLLVHPGDAWQETEQVKGRDFDHYSIENNDQGRHWHDL